MKRIILASLALLASACATYTTPSAGVSLASISEKDSDIRDAYARQPAAQFPVRLAVARVASSGYQSMSNKGYGRGAFSVLTERDIESEAALQKIGAMSRVIAVAPVSRLFLNANLSSTRDLREAAAQLRADVLLIYTIDSAFHTDTTQLGPLQTVALGMLSSKKSTVTSTCAFTFVDVRTGFVYGAGETTAESGERSNMWTTDEAVDRARRSAETKAFEKAVDDASKLWTSILTEHGAR